LCTIVLFANNETILIDKISISGNDHTKPEVISRELRFELGDDILLVDLSNKLEKSEESLMNTGLFKSAKIYFKNWEGSTKKVHIQVEVVEAWYIYPVPIFELADRNFNVWWIEQEKDLNRIKLGIDFTHVNLTGRRDRLNFAAKYGYVRQYSLKYSFPYLNKNRTIGLEGQISYEKKREVNYLTAGNKQLFYNERDKFIYQKFSTRLGVLYRPGHHITHDFGLSYNRKSVDPLILSGELNPLFFPNGATSERAFSLSYSFTYDLRDVRTYPLNGAYFQGKVTKPGIGIFDDKNLLLLAVRYFHYFQFGEKWSTGYEIFAKTSLIRTQPPFENNHIMGSSSTTVPGYEYYILDGLDAALLKINFRFRLFDNVINFGRLMPLQAFKKIPIKVYLRANNGWGYANDPFDTSQNTLNKNLMWGGGPALDVIFFHDIVFRFEYSFNHLGEKGLFLHFNSNL
jgi:outer membrane protein assembly factor BamA